MIAGVGGRKTCWLRFPNESVAPETGLTWSSWSSQLERFRDFTLLISGMLRWIPEQSKQMKTPREQEPHVGSSEGRERRSRERDAQQGEGRGSG